MTKRMTTNGDRPAALRAAVYCRVSTVDQADGTSIESQRTSGVREVERRSWILHKVYVDAGESGGSSSRPALDELMADVRAGLIDAIIVTKLDRFSRSLAHLAPTLSALDDMQVVFVSIADNIDSSSASGRAMRGILGVFAEFEREQIAERGVTGQRAKALMGGWPGGSPPYGYRLNGAGRTAQCVADEHERRVIGVAWRALVVEGLTTGQVAGLLNGMGLTSRSGATWTHQRLRRQMEHRGLLGEVWWGQPTRRYGAGHHTKLDRDGAPKYGDPILINLEDPPLSKEEFDDLQVALRRRAYGYKSPSKAYPNSGATSSCGGRYGGVHRKDRHLRQYRCANSKWTSDGRERCDCPRVDADWLDATVWGEVVTLLTSPGLLSQMAHDFLALDRSVDARTEEENDPAALQRRVEDLKRAQVAEVASALKAGVPGHLIAAAVAVLDEEVSALEQQQARAAARAAARTLQAELRTSLDDLTAKAQRGLPALPLERQREVLELLKVDVRAMDGTPRPRLAISGAVPLPPSGPLSHALQGFDGNPTDAAPRGRAPRRRRAGPAACAAPGGPAVAA
ncbi:recombinase family protein [Motilibacter sp. K478]|nr:recombinase family protein [Motilibacter aurantiacus]